MGVLAAARMHCPISFLPLEEIRRPVRFVRSKDNIIYDAEHLARWLMEVSARNPVTNEPVPFECLTDILMPACLPHLSEEDVRQTWLFLRGQRRFCILSLIEKRSGVLGAMAAAGEAILCWPISVAIAILFAVLWFCLNASALYMATKAIVLLVAQKEEVSRELAFLLAQFQHALNLYLTWAHPSLIRFLRLYPNPIFAPVIISWCVALNCLRRTIQWFQPDLADLWNAFYEETCAFGN